MYVSAFDDLDKMTSPLPSSASPHMSLRPPPSQSPRLDPKVHVQRLYAGTPIPSVDSAVESWDSLANLETPASPTSLPPTSPAPIPTAAQPGQTITDPDHSEDAWSSIREWQAGLPPSCQELAKSVPSRWDAMDWIDRRPSGGLKSPPSPLPPLPPKDNKETSSSLNSLQLLGQQSSLAKPPSRSGSAGGINQGNLIVNHVINILPKYSNILIRTRRHSATAMAHIRLMLRLFQ